MFINLYIYLFLYLFNSKRLDAFPMDIYKNNKGNSYNYRTNNKESDLNSLLQENLVESSLKNKINRNDQAKNKSSNNHIPQYMLNLYNVASKEQDSFTEDLFNHGNVVRSYFSKGLFTYRFYHKFYFHLIKFLCSSFFNVLLRN